MLPGDAAADGDAGPQDVFARGDHLVQFSWSPHVEEDVGVQVAIAGVKHVGDAQMVSGADGRNLPHDLRQPATRHHTVLHVVVGGQRPQRAERALAPFPQPEPLRVVLGHAHLARAMVHADLVHLAGTALGELAHSLQLHQQDGIGIARISHGRSGLHRFDGEPVHHLQRGRHDPGCGDVHHGLRGRVHSVKNGQQRAHRFAAAHQMQHSFGHDADRPLGADERAAQIVAGAIRHLPAQPYDAAVIEHHLDAQHVIGRHAVGQRVWAAGVVGDVPAD